MTQISPPDASLYDLILNQPGTVAEPLQISSATLLSTCRLLLDLLIEQRLPVLVCAKLPGSLPQLSEIERYTQLTEFVSHLYLFGSAEPASAEETGVTAKSSLKPRLDRSEDLLEGLSDLPKLTWVRLSAAHPLRRESFLIVLGAQMSLLLLAHRPRSASEPLSSGPLHSGPLLNGPLPKGSAQTTDAAGRKRPLLALCSFDPATLRTSLNGLRSVLLETLPPASGPTQIQRWDEWVTQLMPPSSAAAGSSLLSRLVTSLLIRQEDLNRESLTLRKQAESAEELHLKNEELLNNLRLKDEFLGLVSQELRTPLTNMKTALSLIQSPALKPPQRQRYLKVLSDECDRQGSLVNGLVNLIHLDQNLDATELQPLQLAEVVPGLASTYQPIAQEKGIMLAYTVPSDLPLVSCHSAGLKQIVINLIDNSIKFTSLGGQVWIRARAQGEYVQLEFRDTGVGIPQQDVPRIFDRFYRVRSLQDDPGGIGLGLSIVQRLLLRCGGSVTVRSKVGEGSTFTVLLPVYGDT